jgi:hypothetical protein
MRACASRRTSQDVLVEKRQRFQTPLPAVLQKVVEAVVKEVASPESRGRQSPVSSV